ncbi:MAG: hypothetical protein JOY61_02760 [Chloroflexi bacterium]|nr:hypothetical protein [Chloroflexota bacterium]
MRTCLDELLEHYDVALLDSPSLLAVVDALALVPVADRVLLVVRRAQASAEALWTAREQLLAARARAISVVLNRAAPEDRSYTYYTQASSTA